MTFFTKKKIIYVNKYLKMTIILKDLVLPFSRICVQVRHSVFIISIIIFISLFSQSVAFSQPCTNTLNGNYTVGTGGDYTTLTAAANAYNNSCLSGPVVFTLININYSSLETFPIVFNKNVNAGINTILTIRPSVNINANITGAINSNALLRILGDFIIIDGSNNGTNSKNITFANTSITAPRVILFGSIGTAAVTNCKIKNCIISNGNNDKASVTLSDATVIANPGYFSNIEIENNKFNKALYGIYCKAVLANYNGNGLKIIGNDMASTGINAIQNTGIYLEAVDGALIKDNIIANFKGTDSACDNGIYINTNCKNIDILANKISSLNYTGTGGYGPRGIFISTGIANANVNIVNNMISNLSGDGNDYTITATSLNNPTGILLNSATPQGSIHIYHNSISLGSVVGFTNTLNNINAISACIRLRVGCTADIRNNILVNNLGLLSGVGYGAIGITVSAVAAQFEFLDNNDYYINPIGLGNKLFGQNSSTTQYPTFASWKTATSKDISSVNISPVFISATDLHLNAIGNEALNNLGTPISGYASDIDYTSRSALKPDIGCDEYLNANGANWIGETSTDWFNVSNWEAGIIPNEYTDLTISSGTRYLPNITGNCKIRNLNLTGNGNDILLTVEEMDTLEIYGSMSRTGGCINISNATLLLEGIAVQTIPPNFIYNNKLSNLYIDNRSIGGVNLGGPLDIYKSLMFMSNGLKLNTNDFLTLKSTATETAWVGDLTGKTITGNVTVERFIPTGINHAKAWQFVAVPLNGNQTINQAWQDTATSANQSRYAGYGTQITSSINPLPPLFDVYTAAGGTMKTYNSLNNSWVGVANTTSTSISNPKGYFVFVRGDRTVFTYNAAAVPTVLRAQGKLYTASIGELPPSTTVSADKFESIGNPYASAIDFLSLLRTGITDNTFYLWDPMLPGTRGLGGYQTISAANGYRPVPGGTSNYSGLLPFTKIQSGQAFFVHATGAGSGGTISFREAAKISGSQLAFREAENTDQLKYISASLYTGPTTNDKIADGNVVSFNSNYSNLYTADDALKINNAGENFSLICGDKSLSIEAKYTITINDTIFYSLSNLKKQTYQLRFNSLNLETLNFLPWLIDKYNNTEHLLSLTDSTFIDFTVNDSPESFVPNRFYIVFKPAQALPVGFVSISANKIESGKNKIYWKVENQFNIDRYEIERSSNGNDFSKIFTLISGIQNAAYVSYSYIDSFPLGTMNFYRIKAMSRNDKTQYSSIVNVSGNNILTPVIYCYPNVVNENNSVKIILNNFNAGSYQFNLYNSIGQKLHSKSKEIFSSSTMYTIEFPINVKSGIYSLVVLLPNAEMITKQIIVQ